MPEEDDEAAVFVVPPVVADISAGTNDEQQQQQQQRQQHQQQLQQQHQQQLQHRYQNQHQRQLVQQQQHQWWQLWRRRRRLYTIEMFVDETGSPPFVGASVHRVALGIIFGKIILEDLPYSIESYLAMAEQRLILRTRDPSTVRWLSRFSMWDGVEYLNDSQAVVQPRNLPNLRRAGRQRVSVRINEEDDCNFFPPVTPPARIPIYTIHK